MEIIKDKIYDVYYSDKNTLFQRKVRERTHWMCRNVTGNNVLDIGCSQGITAILLGREGKNVLGIDISESAIQDAKKNLELEEEETHNCITFEKANFMLKEFEQQYSTIILGEVLEHINDIQSFFSKASSLLEENGNIIVTTPFGINDFIDHKRTFYLNDFINLQNKDMSIMDVRFFGKWIGVVYKKNENEPTAIDEDLLVELEKAFYNVERDLLNSQKKLTNQISGLKEEKKIIEEKKKIIEEEKKIIEEEKQAINDKIIGEFEISDQSYKQKYTDEKVEKVKLQKTILDQYKREERLLKENEVLMEKVNKLENRYYNLKNSKLGKLTTKYWKLRNKRRN
ncbi:class I SAM-dependent methyltransferase [Oceanobacillus rekensis]|uniref:class I SAM-dependent methyltransferase n=1 Tax=Oceanobacillus rekensis TaxID=937927 RepID=UPI000B44CED7|nr:methyltransferase domain-containing protein [Oceanobacillus rekensis]